MTLSSKGSGSGARAVGGRSAAGMELRSHEFAGWSLQKWGARIGRHGAEVKLYIPYPLPYKRPANSNGMSHPQHSSHQHRHDPGPRHEHGHGAHRHDAHGHRNAGGERRLLLALLILGSFTLVEAGGGYLATSIALLAGAAHLAGA